MVPSHLPATLLMSLTHLLSATAPARIAHAASKNAQIGTLAQSRFLISSSPRAEIGRWPQAVELAKTHRSRPWRSTPATTSSSIAMVVRNMDSFTMHRASYMKRRALGVETGAGARSIGVRGALPADPRISSLSLHNKALLIAGRPAVARLFADGQEPGAGRGSIPQP